MGGDLTTWRVEWNPDGFSGKVTHVPTGAVFLVARNGAMGVLPNDALDEVKLGYGDEALEAMLGRLMFECSQLPELQTECGECAWARDDPRAESLH